MSDLLRDTGGAGNAEGGDAGAGLHQQAVGVPVITAREFDHKLATGIAARQTDSGHRGFGAGIDEAQLFDRRNRADDEFR